MSRTEFKARFAELFKLAWPVFIAQLAVMSNGLIDTLMAGRYSTLDLAAVGIGSAIYFSVFVTFMGVLLAISPISAQLYGAGRHAEIGEQVRQSGWLGLILAIVCFTILRHPDPLMAISQLQPEVEQRTRDYLAALSWGVPAGLAFRVFHGFSTAVSRPRTLMVLNLIGLALKLPLNWIFMYGYFGAPEMGGVGCGVASAIVFWVVALLAWGWTAFDQDYRRYGVFARFSRPDWKAIGAIVSLGLPIGVTFMVDVTGFTFMSLFIARLGPEVSAAHQVAANFSAMLFMLPLAMGNAGSVMVGQALGAGKPLRARSAGIIGIGTGFAIAFATGIAVFLLADVIAGLYSNDAGVRKLAGGLLAFVAFYHLFDALQAVAVNVLRGYKRAVVPMVIYAVSLWGVGLCGGYVLGLTDWVVAPMGAQGYWTAAIASLVMAGSLVTAYFLYVSRAEIAEHGRR